MRQKGEGDKREIWTLDTATLDYRQAQKVKLPSLDAAKNVEDTRERLKMLAWSKDRVGAFLWKTISKTLTYTAERIPEIADTVVEVDRAMRWGFGMKQGPFELWQEAGWAQVAKWVQEDIDAGEALTFDGAHDAETHVMAGQVLKQVNALPEAQRTKLVHSRRPRQADGRA